MLKKCASRGQSALGFHGQCYSSVLPTLEEHWNASLATKFTDKLGKGGFQAA
jgi:hypothetical protein